MEKEKQPYTEIFSSKRTLAVYLTGPHVKRAKPAKPDEPEVPAYKYFTVKSSVYDSSIGSEIKASVLSEEVRTEDREVAKSSGFDRARFWAKTSF